MTDKWHLTIVNISYLQNISLKCKFGAKEPNNRPQKSFTDCSVRHIERTVQSLYLLSWTTVHWRVAVWRRPAKWVHEPINGAAAAAVRILEQIRQLAEQRPM